jgi:hypothetical protein
LTILRNGRSVTPVIGARMTGASMRTGPIEMGLQANTARSHASHAWLSARSSKAPASPRPRVRRTSSSSAASAGSPARPSASCAAAILGDEGQGALRQIAEAVGEIGIDPVTIASGL